MKSGPDDVDDDDDAIIIIEARTGVAGVACAGLEFAVGDCSGCNSVASVYIYIYLNIDVHTVCRWAKQVIG